MAPQVFPSGRGGHTYQNPNNTRVRRHDELARFDDILLGVTLGSGVRSRLREQLLNAVEEKVRLRDQLARGAQDLRQREKQLEDLEESLGSRNYALCRENAALQSQMAAMRKGDAFKKPEPGQQDRTRQAKKLPDGDANAEALRKRSAIVQEEARKLREEVRFLREIVNDRGDSGLLALFEGGKKLFDKQSHQMDKLTTHFTARIDEAVHAAEVAKQEKDEVVTTLEAKLIARSSEKHEAMAVLEENLNAQLREKDATIGTLKEMGKSSQSYHYPHFMAGAGTAQHIPNVESTLLFVQSLKRDVEARDRTVANLRMSEANFQAKQAEMVTFSATRKTSQLELQGRFDALKEANAELTTLFIGSQKLIEDLNSEHERLVREMGKML